MYKINNPGILLVMVALSGIPGRLVQIRTLNLHEDTVEISESNSIYGNELLKFSCQCVIVVYR